MIKASTYGHAAQLKRKVREVVKKPTTQAVNKTTIKQRHKEKVKI